MSTSNTDTDSRILKDRLNKVQVAVKKATQDAWKSSGIPTKTNNDERNNASFLLGMDLFGQDPSTLEVTIREKLEDLEQEVEKLLDRSSSFASLGVVEEKDEEEVVEEEVSGNALQQEIQELQTQIAFLRHLSLARTSIDESKTFLSASLSPTGVVDLVQSSQTLVKGTERIRHAESFVTSLCDTANQAACLKLVELQRNEIRRQRVLLVTKASQMIDQNITLSFGSITVKHVQQMEHAYQVLEELQQPHTSSLNQTIRSFTKHLLSTILKPILMAPLKQWTITEKQDKNKNSPFCILEFTPSTDPMVQGNTTTVHVQQWQDTFTLLTRVLVFVQDKILANRQIPSEIMGELLFGDPQALPSSLNLVALGLDSSRIGNDKGMLLELLLEQLSKTCLPEKYTSSAASSTSTMTLQESAALLKSYALPFCKALCQRCIIPMSPKPSLIKFCDELPQNYIQHRRCILLQRARDLLIHNDYHNTVPVGAANPNVDPGMEIFQLQPCSISDTAHKLLQLVRQTMDEAVDAEQQEDDGLQTLRPTLYKTAREMLALFRAVVPSSHKQEIQTLPRTAAVLHNDCIYLAHSCLTLGLEYKNSFTTPQDDNENELLQQSCIFVDMVPLFREMADEALGDMLDTQTKQLQELVVPRLEYFSQSLKSNESLHEWSQGETSLEAASYHLKHLAQNWETVLSKNVFLSSMGHLANTVLSIFSNQLLSNNSLIISTVAKQFLSSLFAKALTQIGELVDEGSSSEKLITPSQACREWDRFVAIKSFLEVQNVPEIHQHLTKGVFLHLSSQELILLLNATFGQSSMSQAPEYMALMNALSTFD